MPTVDELYEQLKQRGAAKGVSVDESYKQDLARTYQGDPNSGAGARNSDDIFKGLSDQIDKRASNTPNQGAPSAQSSSPAQAWNQQPSQPDNSAGHAFYQQLLDRSKQSLSVDPNDPAIKSQTDAFRAEQTRAGRDYVSDQAERLGPYAGGALEGERRIAAEHAGQATASFQGELMGRELSARRDEIAQALSLLSGRLSATEQMALQRELAQIDAQLRSRGLDLQERGLDMSGDQFARELALRAFQVGDQSALNWASL